MRPVVRFDLFHIFLTNWTTTTSGFYLKGVTLHKQSLELGQLKLEASRGVTDTFYRHVPQAKKGQSWSLTHLISVSVFSLWLTHSWIRFVFLSFLDTWLYVVLAFKILFVQCTMLIITVQKHKGKNKSLLI